MAEPKQDKPPVSARRQCNELALVFTAGAIGTVILMPDCKECIPEDNAQNNKLMMSGVIAFATLAVLVFTAGIAFGRTVKSPKKENAPLQQLKP